MSNVVEGQFRQGGGGAVTPTGGDGGMEARIAALETSIKHMDGSITEIKTDVRGINGHLWKLFFSGVGAVVFLLVTFATGYIRLSDKVDDLSKQLSQIQVTLQQVADAVAVKKSH